MSTKFIYAGFSFAVLILIAVGYMVYIQTNNLFDSVYSVVHTKDVVQKLEEIHSHIKDMESAQRGYVITGNEEYLKPYYESHNDIIDDFNNLKKMTIDNPVQQNNINLFGPVLFKKRDFIDEIIKNKKNGEDRKADDLIKSLQGVSLMNEINKYISEMKDEEYNLLKIRTDNAQQTFIKTLMMGFSGIGISVIILFIVFVFLLKEIKFRKRTENILENKKKKLEKSEEEIISQQRLLNSVINSIKEGIIVVDEEDNFKIVNPASEKIFDEKINGKKHSEFFYNYESYFEDGETPYPGDKFPVNNNINEYSEESNIVCIKNKKTNVKKWLDLTFNVLLEQNSKKKLGVFTIRDITMERFAKEKIRESEDLLQKILERLPVGVYIADKDGKIVKENITAVEIWQGKKFIELNKYAKRKGINSKTGKPLNDEDWAMERAYRNGEFSKNEEIEIECYDGTRKYILSSAFPIYSKKGEMINAVEVNYDITKLKEDEIEIKNLNKELNNNYEQLSILNKELEAFSYSVSHDLRAPLRHMQGFSDLLKKHIANSIDEKSSYYIDKISASAKEMGQLIDDLLVFSRIGRSEIKKADVNLDLLTGEVIYELKQEIKNRKIKWNIQKLPVIKGDYFLVKTVIVNLISNALKFTSEKEVAIIDFGYKENENEFEFYIKDNGAGFDMEYYDKLFGVFQRLHTKEEFEGTGIGLASVKRIITRHGGKVSAEAELNKGATFYFSFLKN